MSKKTTKKAKNAKLTMRMLLILAAVFFIGAVILTAIVSYGGGRHNIVTRNVDRVVPMPAAIVGTHHVVPMRDLERNIEATRTFYENQDLAALGIRVDFSTEAGQKKLRLWERTLLDKLIEDKIIELLAKKYNVALTDQQVHERFVQEIKRSGNGRATQEKAQELWGFTLKDFEERIVRPSLYQEELERAVAGTYDTTRQREKITAARTALEDGIDFSQVAQEYSDSIVQGAPEIAGWFAYQDLLPAVSEVAFALPIGGYSDIIETPTGFSIITIDDKRQGPEGDQVLLRHIIVFKPTFADWLDAEIAKYKVRIPLKDYYWNEETRHVDFQNEELKQFMEEVIREAEAQVMREFDAETAEVNADSTEAQPVQ